MGKGGYLGGSTVVRAFPSPTRAKGKGLLALEVEFQKTGKVSPQPLTSSKPTKKKAKPTNRISAAAKTKTPIALADSSPTRAASETQRKGDKANAARKAAAAKSGAAATTHAARYAAVEITEFLRQHHPNCPKAARKRVTTLAGLGTWTGIELAEVVASCMENYLLYEVCGLQRLVDCGIARDRALEMLTPQVKAVLSFWGAKPVWRK